MDLPPELWTWLGQSADTLGVLGFLNGLVGYVGKKRAAGEKATIEDYLERVRRQEHREISELVLANAAALDALRKLTERLVSASTEQILGVLQEIGADVKSIKTHVQASVVPRIPEVEVKISRHVQIAIDRQNGLRSFQLQLILTNRSNSVATIAHGWASLAYGNKPLRANDGDFIHGCTLQPNNDASRALIARTRELDTGAVEPRLISVRLEVAQDDEPFRYYLPDGDQRMLKEFRSNPSAGVWAKAKVAIGDIRRVRLLYPSDEMPDVWTVADESGALHDVPVDRVLV